MAAPHYGYLRDELYFIDCGKHLDWSYVDLQPFVAVITRLVGAGLGYSLTALRFSPALAGALKVMLAGLIARELGGDRFAQALAALAVVVAPAYLAADHFLTMNAFEPLFWNGCAWVFIRLVKTKQPQLWLGFGALAGLGLENKYSMLFFGFSFVCGLLLTGDRKLLLCRWFWLGGLTALLLFVPSLIWEIHRGFPTVEFFRNHHLSTTNVSLTPIEFLAEQALVLHPLACPLWIAGVWYYLGTWEGKPYRALGWTYLVVVSLLLILKGRVYYLVPVYPMLLASGAVLAEKLTASRWAWARAVYVGALIVGGAFLAPFGLPILPVSAYIQYSKTLDLDPPAIENRKLGKLPELYAEMFGWEEMTAAVARVYHLLPARERAKTAIFANDYGQAGAINFFGPNYGLPAAICPKQNYYYWGPGDNAAESIILLGHNPALEHECVAEEQAGIVQNEFSMPYQNFPVLLCRGLKRPLKQMWPRLKVWAP